MMKSKLILIAAALMSGAAAWGVKADPTLTRIVNPDGSVVEIREIGDENFSFFTDAEGRFLLERDAAGNFREAYRDGRRLEAVASDIALLQAEAAMLNNLPRLNEEYLQRAQRQGMQRKIFNVAADGRTTFPTTGEKRALVVLLEYPECGFAVENPVDLFTRKCNEPGFSDYGGKGSVKDYFEANSNGRFSPTFDVVGPVKLPQSSDYYTGGYRMQKFYEAVRYAITTLDETVDFTQYDGDGLIDTVFFYFAGHGQNDTKDTSLIWPHMNDYRKYVVRDEDRLMVDGVEMGSYACSSELKGNIPEGEEQPWLDGIGTHVHEYGHVFGLPDLYDTAAEFFSTTSPETWSVMDRGNYLNFATTPIGYSAYEKYFCRWIDDLPQITPGEHYELASMSDTDTPHVLSIRVPKDAAGTTYHDEWFIFETRTQDAWDAGIPEEGMLIWHINYDESAWSDNKVNVNRKPRWEVLHPDSYHNRYTWPGADGSAFYLCPDVTTTLKPSNTSPGFSVILDDIRFDEEKKQVSFGYNRITERPTCVTTLRLHDVDPENRNLTFTWDAVDGADDYLLTLTCYDEDNWFRVVNGYDEKSTNGKTKVVVENLMEKFWNFEMTAYVRVVDKVPSTETSAKMIFTPAKSAGVESVESESHPVRGLTGAIDAPAGATVYDLQGVQRATQGLAPGLYIVVVDGKATKVIVK